MKQCGIFSRANMATWNKLNHFCISFVALNELKIEHNMEDQIKDIPLRHNREEHTFEMDINGDIAFIGYEEDGDTIILTHTEVPEALEGKGIGSVLVLKTLNHIEAEGNKIIVQCAFVASYIKRHPEWERLVK